MGNQRVQLKEWDIVPNTELKAALTLSHVPLSPEYFYMLIPDLHNSCTTSFSPSGFM